MASDIKLNGNGVLVEGTDITFDRGVEQSSIALNLKNPKGFWHISGPRSYEPNNPLSIFWHNNTQFSGPFLSVTTNGSVGIGTNNPVRSLHVEGNEIHSSGGGAGFSFSDRSKPEFVNNPTKGERWVWYAQDGNARLWSGEDVLTVKEEGDTWRTVFKGRLEVEKSVDIHGSLSATRLSGKVGLFTGQEMSEIGATEKVVGVQLFTQALQMHAALTHAPKHLALFHDFDKATNKDVLVINRKGGYVQGVRIDGDVQVIGKLTQASSITLKENVAELSGQEAIATLQGLNAVKYNYKADEQKQQHIGFIAEEVPDLVASAERDRLSPMDIVAVLTKAMQEQQKLLAELAAEVSALRGQGR